MKKKVILAYSGGLDTSIILKWLVEQDYDVIAYLADVGQHEDFAVLKEKALKTGASKVYVEDLKKEFVTDFIFPILSGNAVYEGRYLLGTALARPLIAKKQMDIAIKEGADFVAHGGTGKGNDQARFELAYYALKSDIQVLSPWKMPSFLSQFKGRSDMLNYAEKHGIPVAATKAKPYSNDENLLHTSYESGILEDPSSICAEEVYSRTTAPENAPDHPDIITVSFKHGIPVKVENKTDKASLTDPLLMFQYINTLGSKHGIGRMDMVENRFVGIKSRGVYETPGGTILLNAHKDLEGITMDREVMRIRDVLSLKFADLIYNGFWFSPEMDFIMHCIRKSQENINGDVTVKLYKGVAYAIARKSNNSLYDMRLSSMDEIGSFNQEDSEGFIKINALRIKSDYFMKQLKNNANHENSAGK